MTHREHTELLQRNKRGISVRGFVCPLPFHQRHDLTYRNQSKSIITAYIFMMDVHSRREKKHYPGLCLSLIN